MTPERWQQVQTLLGAALERPPDERPGYLAGMCAEDEELRREVESLLQQASAGSGFLSTPAFDIATQPASYQRTSLVGRVIGPFSIKRRLDSGGMGDVYLADDSSLRRRVAIKVLRESGPPTPEGRERLLREAQHAAALNHPNIATIFHVLKSVDADTPPLMVMEYVEGETLAERLRRGPLPLDQALRFTRDVADALAAAHALSIVHRDLKPANLRVNQQERIKVLDFGLARQLAPAVDTSTMTVARTAHSVVAHRIAGTPGYAAPEQALGLAVGKPADIFSLGVVLFEMLTGRRPFPGDELYTSGAAIMAMPTPRLSDSLRTIPAFVNALVSKMLAKEPSERPSAADVAAAIDTIGALGVRPASSRARRLGAAAAIVALAGGLATAGIRTWRAPGNAAPAGRPSIAVLPLDNLSGDRSKDYLGVGIAETLTTSLSKLPTISVISRTSLSEATRGADVRTIAREVGATFVLQGSVQQSGDRLRVSAKLLRGDGSVAWAGDADAMTSELFPLETRLAASVIAALPVNVSEKERQAAVAQPPTKNREALEAYWQGLALLDRNDPRSLSAAIDTFQRATSLDPQFAAAFGALGESYRQQYARLREPDAMTKATAAITHALDLDPNRVDVRLYLGALYSDTGRPAEAADEFRTVIAQHPDNDEAHRRLGLLLNATGRPQDALQEYQAAVSIRPDYWRNQQSLGYFFYTQKRLREAIAAFTRVIELRHDANSYLQRGAALEALGNRADARVDLQQSIALDKNNPAAYSNLGVLEYEERRYEDAIQAFTAAIRLRPKQEIYHRNLGDAYARLRRVDAARGEYLTAVSLVQDALVVNPNDANALSRLAVYEAKLGRADDARRHANEALARNSTIPDVLYRRGVALALVGDVSGAISALADAVQHGYNVDQIRTEEDLAGLENVPEFRKLVLSGR